MNTHFCKVGKVRNVSNKTNNEPKKDTSKLEKAYSNQIEEAYNIKQTDASLSDTLYHEAQKIKRQLLSIKANANNFDAAF